MERDHRVDEYCHIARNKAISARALLNKLTAMLIGKECLSQGIKTIIIKIHLELREIEQMASKLTRDGGRRITF